MLRSSLGRLALVAAFGCSACDGDGKGGEDGTTYTREQLLDPQTCRDCHTTHYDEWSGSMHAYAADDPVFRAMNQRGQEETNGKLGSFCVRCHAPMALAEGATTDGLNLDTVPQSLKGVTCYFCHNVESVEGTHNNPLVLANDTTMRGGFDNAVANPAHRSAYSQLLDSRQLKSSDACGACHDLVVTPEFAPAEVHLERTFAEWKATIFNSTGPAGLRCASSGTCHMPAHQNVAIAEYDGVLARTRHEHKFPGVDLAVTEFPNIEDQRAQIQRLLDRTIRVEVCVSRQLPQFRVLLDNAGAGHSWPSGAGQDRRAWVEVTAYSGDRVIYESGAAADDQDVTTLESDGAWVFRDQTFKADGSPAHMFWDVATIKEGLIPGPVTLDQNDPRFLVTHVSRIFPPPPRLLQLFPDRVRVRVRVRPIGLDVLDDLNATGHLDPQLDVARKMPIFTLSPARLSSPPWDPAVTIEFNPTSKANPQYGNRGDTINNLPADCVVTGAGRVR